MGKRPASRDDDDAADVDREAECRGTLRALNAQFAAWVATRAVESPIVSWAEGCRDYLKHLDALKVRATTVDRRVTRETMRRDALERVRAFRTTDDDDNARVTVIFHSRAERL